jgi:hypothetical protein
MKLSSTLILMVLQSTAIACAQTFTSSTPGSGVVSNPTDKGILAFDLRWTANGKTVDLIGINGNEWREPIIGGHGQLTIRNGSIAQARGSHIGGSHTNPDISAHAVATLDCVIFMDGSFQGPDASNLVPYVANIEQARRDIAVAVLGKASSDLNNWLQAQANALPQTNPTRDTYRHYYAFYADLLLTIRRDYGAADFFRTATEWAAAPLLVHTNQPVAPQVKHLGANPEEIRKIEPQVFLAEDAATVPRVFR